MKWTDGSLNIIMSKGVGDSGTTNPKLRMKDQWIIHYSTLTDLWPWNLSLPLPRKIERWTTQCHFSLRTEISHARVGSPEMKRGHFHFSLSPFLQT